jgi:hypothetical protein
MTQRAAALQLVVADALKALGRPGALAKVEAEVPQRPGLYAIYGDRATWSELGLGAPPDGRPLYVGKAEDSLADRDLKKHFGDGQTGRSTVRRSFAALLHDTLGLRGIPRKLDHPKPIDFTNYGLSADHGAALTRWMRDRLLLATWPRSPKAAIFTLKTIEVAVLSQLVPPLNLLDVVTPWRAHVKAARAVMVAEARAWHPS